MDYLARMSNCPFCGGRNLYCEPDERGSGGQWVAPIHVGCARCCFGLQSDDLDEAISAWNRRAPQPDASAEGRTASEWDGNAMDDELRRLAPKAGGVATQPSSCPYCTSDNQAIRETYFDQYCIGCADRMFVPSAPLYYTKHDGTLGEHPPKVEGSSEVVAWMDPGNAGPVRVCSASRKREAHPDSDIGKHYVVPLVVAPSAPVAGSDAQDGAAFYVACQRAAAELPHGWEIRVCLERDAGTVELCDPDGNVTHMEEDADDRLTAEVNAAIDAALEAKP